MVIIMGFRNWELANKLAVVGIVLPPTVAILLWVGTFAFGGPDLRAFNLIEDFSTHFFKKDEELTKANIVLQQKEDEIVKLKANLMTEELNRKERAQILRLAATTDLFKDLRNLETAYTLLQIAVELDPQESSGWKQLGHVLYLLKRYDEAVITYEKVVKIAQACSDEQLEASSYCNQMIIRKDQGKINEAINYGKKARLIYINSHMTTQYEQINSLIIEIDSYSDN